MGHCMNKQEAKAYLTDYVTSRTERSKRGGKSAYICPICNSGTGRNKTGAFYIYSNGTKWKCHACGKGGDIFDLVGELEHITDPQEQFKRVEALYNLPRTGRTGQKQPQKTSIPAGPDMKPETDFTPFFKQANKNLKDTNYHRGISLTTLNRFNVGFVKGWTSPTADKKVPSDRLIIPTSKYSYIARATDDRNPLRIMKEGKTHLFNPEALTNTTQPVFIVEGELDALSIIDLGFEAVGLGGLGNIPTLLQAVETLNPTQPLIVALDDDTAGQKAQQALKAQNRPTNAFWHFTQAKTLYAEYKDANGAYKANAGHFKTALEAETIQATQEAEQLNTETREAYRQNNSVSAYMEHFYNTLKTKQAKPTPTGFTAVDTLLDGGLFAGLYIVGAISSLGKTTFSLQIADQIANSGKDVLIFSLEMAKSELIAKSVSRLTYQETLTQSLPYYNASTTRTVLKGLTGPTSNQIQRDLITKCIYRYNGEYASRVFITEGVGDVGVGQIREQVAEFTRIYKRAPVVIVDYIQIIAPADVKATDKQNTDKAVLELKRISRDFNTPVIGISSFNRENYTAPVNLASFKESGAIEYSSDVLIGLQYEGMDYKKGDNATNRPARIRELTSHNEALARKGQPVPIEVKILKSRNGSKGTALLQFVPMFNCFLDDETVTPSQDTNDLYSMYGESPDEDVPV